MLEAAVRRATTGQRLVLAVSGGRDSMALLHAVARVAPRSAGLVATFHHGTGAAATRATQFVAREAARLGLPVVIGHAPSGTRRTEAAWREARLRFLNEVAGRSGTLIATAHTRDDQVETVLMRVLRDAGARGLAGLYASNTTVRPLLDLTRADVEEYLKSIGAGWVDDPSNESPRHLRNRIRRDLLPALGRADSGIDDALLATARRAARWRRDLDRIAAAMGRLDEDRLVVSVAELLGEDDGRAREELAVLWPALAARVGVVMDRRGTLRAASFAMTATPGARMQLSGGFEIVRTHDAFELQRAANGAAPTHPSSIDDAWNGWRFDALPVAPASRGGTTDAWTAWLPSAGRVTVRAWQPGDRMRVQSGVLRKVKRFLSDSHISGPRRSTWPVVLVDDEIVWIPGVRRAEGGPARTSDAGLVYRCVPAGR